MSKIILFISSENAVALKDYYFIIIVVVAVIFIPLANFPRYRYRLGVSNISIGSFMPLPGLVYIQSLWLSKKIRPVINTKCTKAGQIL